jgi:DNA-binding transcriptional MerR regulator
MPKSRDAFRTISEVSDVLDTPAHVLRFWESKFTQVKPVKRAGGRRYYRPTDVDLLAGIKQLLHDDGMTIKGAQKLLRENGVKHVAALGAAAIADTPAQTQPRDITPDDGATTIDEVTTQIDAAPVETAEPRQHENVMPLAADTPAPVDQGIIDAKPAPSDMSAVPDDPSDNDSKAPARIFHILNKADPDRLAQHADDIMPLIARIRTLRARIDAR